MNIKVSNKETKLVIITIRETIEVDEYRMTFIFK